MRKDYYTNISSTEYYSYNVQAMLVMFWAAELCQLTYQVGEKRKIRRIFRKVHTAGKFLSWIIPMVTILCLRIPSLKKDFVVFILIADLPCKSWVFPFFYYLLRHNKYEPTYTDTK